MSDYRTTLLAENEKLRAEVERLRALDKEAKSAFAPWVHGPGIVGGILHLQEEVERLRAEANARAVEELLEVYRVGRDGAALWSDVVDHLRKRIAELSKPAAKESEPVPQEKQRRSFAFGNTSIENQRITPEMVDAEAEKLAKESEPAKPVTGPNYLDQEEWGHAKPEEPDWTVTLAAQAKAIYDEDTPDESVSAALLLEVVRGLCNLGREVRRGGAK